MKTICCVCQKEKRKNGWRKQRAQSHANAASVSHGFCPNCYEKAIDQANSQLQKMKKAHH